jgi:hypothetical protein
VPSITEIAWLANARIWVCWLVKSLTGMTGFGDCLPSWAPHWHLPPQLQGNLSLLFVALQQDDVLEQHDVWVEPEQVSLPWQQVSIETSWAVEHPQSAPCTPTGCTNNMYMADHVMNWQAKFWTVLNETTLMCRYLPGWRLKHLPVPIRMIQLLGNPVKSNIFHNSFAGKERERISGYFPGPTE